jgi:hypothetical protein
MEGLPAPDPYATPKANIGDFELPSLAMRARIARWFLFATVVLIVIGIVLTALMDAQLLTADPEAPASPGTILGIGVGCITLVVRLGTVVTFLLWLHAAYVRANVGVADARFTPASSVGWWFVPIANLWQPFAAMLHLWQLSRGGVDWHRVSAPAHFAIWWLALVLSICVNVVALGLAWSAHWVIPGRVLGFVAPCLALVAALLATRIVGEITAMQHERLGID